MKFQIRGVPNLPKWGCCMGLPPLPVGLDVMRKLSGRMYIIGQNSRLS